MTRIELQIQSIGARDLTAGQIAAWSELQLASAEFDSPFFRPEFTQAVAAVRDDVEVAIISRSDEMVGFLPFHRVGRNVAVPVGEIMSDFHGVIAHNDVEFTSDQLLRDCNLNALNFNHLIASQSAFKNHHWAVCDSPYMDISRGFEFYRDDRQQSGSKTIGQVLRKSRKIEREIGPLRLEFHSADESDFQRLVDWKTKQYFRIRSANYLAQLWKVELLREILASQSEKFAGMMSVLYAGRECLAMHLGMRSRDVLHCWFPAYNESRSKYSPGLVFWVYLAQQCEKLGLRRIDLGKGPERYKQSLKSGDTQIAEGAVDTRRLIGALRHRLFTARQLIRNSPLSVPAKSIARNARSLIRFANGSSAS